MINNRTGNVEVSELKLALQSVQHIPRERELHLRDMDSYQGDVLPCTRYSYGFLTGWIKSLPSPCFHSIFPTQPSKYNPVFLIPWCRKIAEPEQAFSLCPVSVLHCSPQVLIQMHFLIANLELTVQRPWKPNLQPLSLGTVGTRCFQLMLSAIYLSDAH